MTNHIFTAKEMENIFEIGRMMQDLFISEKIDIEDSKDAFVFAVQLAVEFEKEYADTEDYYMDLEEFVFDKIMKTFGVEE